MPSRSKDEQRGTDPRGSAPSLQKAPTPALPKGGGAIRGIGEKFSANPITGTGSFSVPIAVTPGRAGFHPELSLVYDSGAGNGPFGLGWHLSVPHISRKTDKRLPEYLDADQSDVYLISGAEDLVPALDDTGVPDAFDRDGFQIRRYRPRIEGLFARLERLEDAAGDVHWVSTTPGNVRNVYGRSPEARIADPADPDRRRVFAWLLERSEDSLGNVIVYTYVGEDLSNVAAASAERHRLNGDAPVTNRYPKRIRYGNTVPGDEQSCVFELVFDYGEHDPTRPEPQPAPGATWPVRLDPFSTYRAGFEVRTYRLCRRILLFHHFSELGPTACLVRATKLTYDERSTLTRLIKVVQEGYVRSPDSGEYSSQAYPPLVLRYGEATIHTAVQGLDAAGVADLRAGVDGRAHQWVDLDGDGIPGVLTDDDGALYYRRNLGGAALAPARRLRERPAILTLAGGGQQLMDLGGDGPLDLVELDRPVPGFHERITPGDPELPPSAADDGGWGPFKPFASRPDLDWNDPNLRFIDLNGDGIEDVLVSKEDVFVWYPSLGKSGYDVPRTFPRPRDEEKGPALVFGDKAHSVFLADLSGDGLRDLVGITNGQVCYWPNLGHGRFGPKVTMAGAPTFASPDQFDPRRILLADVDGSGPTDLLYAGQDGVRLWLNQAGNSWQAVEAAVAFPASDSIGGVTAVDLLGIGTACLVWSSALPDDAVRLRYVDLLASRKPHLLESVDNGLGLETALQYAPSTKFFLADRAAGRPWATRLAFPVHVVERVETYDAVSRVRFVSEYRYRDGYFDGDEREFRGFAYVEQWDTESDPGLSGKGLFADRPPAANGELPQPPVVTRTWFHTGAWLAGSVPPASTLSGWPEPGVPCSAPALPPCLFPAGLTPAESRDAYRALKGQMLRQEILARDGSEKQGLPYTVSERTYEVRRVQSARDGVPGVFFVQPREALEQHTEREPDDPRVRHDLTLEVDDWGHVRRSVTLGYARRPGTAGARTEQQRVAVTLSEVDVANEVEHDAWYRHGVPLETLNYELTGLDPQRSAPLFTFDEVHEAAGSAVAIGYEEAAAGVTGVFEKRLVERGRSRYLDSAHLPAPLPWGEIDAMALPYESYGLALTPSLLASPALYDGRLTDAILGEGGYVHLDDPGDPDSVTGWWVPSGRSLPGRWILDSTGQNDHFEVQQFYLPSAFVDPFGNTTTITYDEEAEYWLLVTGSLDPKGNLVSVENDYRTMSPRLITDPNGNRVSVTLDALGRVIETRVWARDPPGGGAPEGDPPLPGFAPTTKLDYRFYSPATGLPAEDGYAPLQPSCVHAASRETHGRADTKWQHSYSYSDGSGREVMKKEQAEPGLAPQRDPEGLLVYDHDGALVLALANPRWVGTGRTVFDNKGQPIKQYEPFFSATHEYEADEDLIEWGVTPILHYDPMGRLVRTEVPDGTVTRVTFTPWEQESWDANDTVLDAGNLWNAEYASSPEPMKRRAAQLASRHAGTPSVTVFDSLGRPFLAVEDNGPGQKYETRTTLDIEGNPLVVWDALGRPAMTRAFSMLGQPGYQKSIDAGERWRLFDVLGNAFRSWDGLGHELSAEYDVLRRPTQLWVRNPGAASRIVAERTLYGEGVSQARDHNLLGRVYQQFDAVGVVIHDDYDFKGNPTRLTRVLAADARAEIDWAAVPAPSLEADTPFADILEHDALDRPTRVVTSDGSETRTTYNEAALLERVNVRLLGADAWTAFVRSVEYNEKGQRLSIDLGQGVRTEYGYDERTFRLIELVTIRLSDGKRLQHLLYTYDPVGNVVSIEDTSTATVYFDGLVTDGTALYEYDALYRLTWAQAREHAGGGVGEVQRDDRDLPVESVPHPNDGHALRPYREEYQYDAVGNFRFLKHTAVGNDQASWTRFYRYVPGSNQLRETSTAGDAEDGPYHDVYHHDLNGNVTAMPHLPQIDWTLKNELRRCDRRGGGTVDFINDGVGQRVRKVWEHGQVVEERIHLGRCEIYRRHDAGALTLERKTLHVMDGEHRLAVAETKTIDTAAAPFAPTPRLRFQLANQLGSVAVEVDEAGRVISYEEYHPYGTTAYRAATGSLDVGGKRYRYSGLERDEETGFDYCGARHYCSWLGVWVSPDPAGLVDGVNLFRYARDNPVRFVDPGGEDPTDISPWEKFKRMTTGAVKEGAEQMVAQLQAQVMGPDLVGLGTHLYERWRYHGGGHGGGPKAIASALDDTLNPINHAAEADRRAERAERVGDYEAAGRERAKEAVALANGLMMLAGGRLGPKTPPVKAPPALKAPPPPTKAPPRPPVKAPPPEPAPAPAARGGQRDFAAEARQRTAARKAEFPQSGDVTSTTPPPADPIRNVAPKKSAPKSGMSSARRRARAGALKEAHESLQSGSPTPQAAHLAERLEAVYGREALVEFMETGKLPKDVEFSHLFSASEYPEFAHRGDLGVLTDRGQHLQEHHGGDTRVPLHGRPRIPGKD